MLGRRGIVQLAVVAIVAINFVVASPSAKPSPWVWSQDFPACVQVTNPSAHRTVEDVDRFFAARHTVAEVLVLLGRPDAWSPQLFHTRTLASGPREPGVQPQAGTLRFLLIDGGEVHLWFCDCSTVCMVFRYTKNGQFNLLWK